MKLSSITAKNVNKAFNRKSKGNYQMAKAKAKKVRAEAKNLVSQERLKHKRTKARYRMYQGLGAEAGTTLIAADNEATQRAAINAAADESMYKWLSQMDGNPNQSTGQSGSNQSGSTTSLKDKQFIVK